MSNDNTTTPPDGDDKPDPEEFKIQMRTVKASEDAAMRHDDYVGSYSKTGRVKLDKPKWAPKSKPKEGDNAFRVDDWVGSGKPQRKSWKTKSSTTGPTTTSSASSGVDDSSKPAEFVSPSGASVRRWKPPPKEASVPPPWMASPPPASSPGLKPWKPKSHATTSHAKKEVDTKVADLHSSMNHMDLDDTKDTTAKAWKSHSVLNAPTFHKESDDEAAPEEETQANEVASEPAVSKNSANTSTSLPAVDDADDDDKPDPEQYKIQMRTADTVGNSMKHDDFVGSYSNTGRTKLKKKTPSATPVKVEKEDNVFRAEEWMGGGSPMGTRKSWKPRSPHKSIPQAESNVPVKEAVKIEKNVETFDMPLTKVESNPEPELAPAPTVVSATVQVIQPEKETKDSESVSVDVSTKDEEEVDTKADSTPEVTEKTSVQDPIVESAEKVSAPAEIGFVAGDYDGERPDPAQFKIHMRTVQASEDAGLRHDDFVGSYSNTGRAKLEKKKWTPSKKPTEGDNAFRSDDWMGSGKTQRKSWKVKK